MTQWFNQNGQPTSWTDLPKPTAVTGASILAGEPIGLLMALTYSDDSSYSQDIWTYVPKAQ